MCQSPLFQLWYEKFDCIAFRMKSTFDFEPMQLSNSYILLINSVRYKIVYIAGNNKLSFDFTHDGR